MRFRFCEKLIGLGLLPVLAVLAACGGEGAPPSPPPPEVDVMTIRAASVSYTIELPARVQAMRTAEVRARVDGIVERRLYVEGSRSEEHTSELQSLMRISYAVLCLKKKKNK